MNLKELSKELQKIEKDREHGENGLTVQELDVELDSIIDEYALQEK